MKNIFITCILLFSLAGCETAEEKAKAQAIHDAKIIKQARADLMAELKVKKEAEEAKEKAQKKADALKNEKLSQVGISIQNKEITINPEKAKDFFNNLGKKMEEKIHSLTQSLKKGMIEDQDTGVHIDETKINIDLNKTQDFLHTWGKKMQSFVKEIDNMAKSMNSTIDTQIK